MDPTTIYTAVENKYSQAARNPSHEQAVADKVARAFGYSADELKGLPSRANLGLSCGNPVAMAHVSPGETVIDFGSGGGMDALLAAKRVGANGSVLGIDNSRAMVDLARENASKAGFQEPSMRFVHAPIIDIPLDSAIADCIVSNCVINLVPDTDKPRVFREAFRLLRPGGRLAISDVLAKQPLPDKIRGDVGYFVGCVAGASLLEEYRRWMAEVGFEDIVFVDSEADLNVYNREGSAAACCANRADPNLQEQQQGGKEAEGNSMDFNEWIGSYKIFAIKSRTE